MQRQEPEDRSEGARAPSIDGRKAFFGVVLALVLAGGAFTAIGEFAHFGEIARVARTFDPVWVAPCLAGQLLAYVGYMVAYRDVARASGGPRLSLPTTARIVLFGAGTTVVAATVGGLAVDFWALRRTGTPKTVAARRVLAVGTIEWTVLVTFAWLAAAAALIVNARAPLAMSLGWLIAIPACVAGARWFTAGDRARRFTAPPPCEQPSGRTHAARAAWALRRTARASFGNAVSGVILVRHVLAHPLRYRGGAIGYPVYWAGDMLTLYASLRGFGAHLAPELLILAYASGNVITSLPLPAGGAGGVEAAGALTLHVVGVALAPALLAVFVYRLVTFWLPVLPALLLVPSMRRLGEKLSSVPHSERDPDERISFRPPADAAA